MILDVNLLELVSPDILNIKTSGYAMEDYAEDILYQGIVPNLYTLKNKDNKLLLAYNQERGFFVGNIFFNMILVNFVSMKNLQDLKNNFVPINSLLFGEKKVYIVLEAYNIFNKKIEERLFYRTEKKNLLQDTYPREGTLLNPWEYNLEF